MTEPVGAGSAPPTPQPTVPPNLPDAWQRVRDDVIRFDRAGIRRRAALRMAIGTTVALSIGYAAGSWAAGAAAAGGALSVGIPSVTPAARPRVAVLTSTAAGISLGTFIGSATSGYAALHVVAVAVFTFACGLLVAIEPAATAVGLNAVVGLVVYGRFPASPQTALQSAGLVAAGGLFQVALAVVAHGRTPVSRALAGLSRAYDSLAGYARQLDTATSSLVVAGAIDAATTDLEFSFATGTSREACASLVGEARRIRLELLSLASARTASVPATGAATPAAPELAASFEHLAACLERFLAVVAHGLRDATVPPDLHEALTATEHAIDQVRVVAAASAGGLTAARTDAASGALAGQLRAVAALFPVAVDVRGGDTRRAYARSAGQVSRRGALGAEAIVERMWANLTWRSDAFQHAVRLTTVVTAAAVLAHAIGIGRGYWLALTAVLVLRPEFSVTFTRGFARALGTLVGVGVSTAVALGTHPHGWALVALVGVFVWCAGALFNASYAVFSVAVTGAVVFLLAGIDPHPVATARERLIATVLGAALALGAYALWPAWGRRRVADAIAELADSTWRYVGLVLRALVDPAADRAGAAAAGRAVRLARTNAEAAVERSLGDPASRRIDHSMTVELLATLRRLAIAAHTLRLAPAPERKAGPRALELVDALDRELGAAAARLSFGRVTVVRSPLRELHRQLTDELRPDGLRPDGLRPDEFGALFLVETDELVDATNSLADLLDQVPAGPVFST